MVLELKNQHTLDDLLKFVETDEFKDLATQTFDELELDRDKSPYNFYIDPINHTLTEEQTELGFLILRDISKWTLKESMTAEKFIEALQSKAVKFYKHATTATFKKDTGKNVLFLQGLCPIDLLNDAEMVSLINYLSKNDQDQPDNCHIGRKYYLATPYIQEFILDFFKNRFNWSDPDQIKTIYHGLTTLLRIYDDKLLKVIKLNLEKINASGGQWREWIVSSQVYNYNPRYAVDLAKSYYDSTGKTIPFDNDNLKSLSDYTKIVKHCTVADFDQFPLNVKLIVDDSKIDLSDISKIVDATVSFYTYKQYSITPKLKEKLELLVKTSEAIGMKENDLKKIRKFLNHSVELNNADFDLIQ